MSKSSFPTSLPSNPLFSSIVTLYMLILLYFPQFSLKIVISPVLISTFILMLSLLRLGASQQHKAHNDPNEAQSQPLPEPEPIILDQGRLAGIDPHCNGVETRQSIEPGPGSEPEHVKFDKGKNQIDPSQRPNRPETQSSAQPDPRFEPAIDPHFRCLDWPEPGPSPFYRESFEWHVGAPLEAIYEAYEGEEEGEEGKNDAFDECNYTARMIQRYPSLSRYYPESDSNSDSDNSSISWEDEEEREGLIEIDVDYHGNQQGLNKLVKLVNVDDEDNLIEIDISPTRPNYGFSW